MAVITTHDVTLTGRAGGVDLVLRPLCDDHLPLLCRWNADPEIVYWEESGPGKACTYTEGEDAHFYDKETVCSIYGAVSCSAVCFLVEADGRAIGECWLQRMNLPEVCALYPGQDVCRIDMTIGEKEFWGRGIGTGLVGMLVGFAFRRERVDVLHCLVGDHNARSQRTFLRNGFRSLPMEDLPVGERETGELHFVLTRLEYECRQGNCGHR